MSSRHWLPISLLLIAAVTVQSTAVYAAGRPTAKTCEEQIAAVNYRADLLIAYKKSENQKYQAVRKKWVNRIAYAAQWVPKDAAKTRDSLYKYDAFHAATITEVSTQIKLYRTLEKRPLTCSSAMKGERARRLAAVKGLEGKKVVGGNALINQLQRKETKFLTKDFKKTSDKLVHKLHKEKRKHPKPEHAKLYVKAL